MEEVDGMENPKNQMVLYSDDAVPERLMSQMSSEIATLFFELPPPLGTSWSLNASKFCRVSKIGEVCKREYDHLCTILC